MLDIFENKEDGTIVINETNIEGFKADIACKLCGKERYYTVKYDTYYCPSCDKWLEEDCGDPHCEFCASRPSKPSDLWDKK